MGRTKQKPVKSCPKLVHAAKRAYARMHLITPMYVTHEHLTNFGNIFYLIRKDRHDARTCAAALALCSNSYAELTEHIVSTICKIMMTFS